jgi:predicted cobalt transporter CbtA
MALTYRSIVWRALLAGFGVGLALAAYLLVVVEPVIDEAVALEEQLAAGTSPAGGADRHPDGGEALFTRAEQEAGGAAASVIYAVVAAGAFGTVFAATRHRIPGRTDLGRSVWLAAVAFGAVALMPAVKYPANPPAVGDPGTVGQRTLHYLILVAVSLLLAWLLTRLSAALRARTSDANRIVAVAAAVATGYGTVLIVMPPGPDAIDPAVPAVLLWDFRVRSIGGLALLWAGLGFGLGWLVERAAAGAPITEATPAPEPAPAA